MSIKLKIGLWGTAGGLIALVVGAIMTLSEGNAQAPSTRSRVPSPSQPRSQSPSQAQASPQPSSREPGNRPGAAPAASALSCAACGAPFPHQVKFCPKCGAKQPAAGGE